MEIIAGHGALHGRAHRGPRDEEEVRAVKKVAAMLQGKTLED